MTEDLLLGRSAGASVVGGWLVVSYSFPSSPSSPPWAPRAGITTRRVARRAPGGLVWRRGTLLRGLPEDGFLAEGAAMSFEEALAHLQSLSGGVPADGLRAFLLAACDDSLALSVMDS